jgi:hypothetical protein
MESTLFLRERMLLPAAANVRTFTQNNQKKQETCFAGRGTSTSEEQSLSTVISYGRSATTTFKVLY